MSIAPLFAISVRYKPFGVRSIGPKPIMPLFGAAILLAVVAGCADHERETRGEVFGTVLLNGQPVETGHVRFVSMAKSSGPSSGGPIVNGKYYIGYKQGPAIGENQVQFSGTRATGKKVVLRGSEIDELVPVFPDKYQNASSEKCTIVAGKNQVDFNLTSK